MKLHIEKKWPSRLRVNTISHIVKQWGVQDVDYELIKDTPYLAHEARYGVNFMSILEENWSFYKEVWQGLIWV